jgi:hypothetical protein
MTYDELVTNIRNYTEVDSNVFSNSVIDTFILMAENRILRDIDLDVFKVEATANMTSGNRFYIYKPQQLSSANPTTWVSTDAPEALLYACLIQAYSYTKGPLEMLQYFENSYKQAIQGLGIEQQGRRRRDEFRDGMIRLPIKSESPGP